MKPVVHRAPIATRKPRPLQPRTNGKAVYPRAAAIDVLRTASWLSTRLDLSNSLAREIYDGLRKVWNVAGYPKSIDTASHFDKWNRGGIGSKILEFYPKLTWDDSIRIRQNRDNPDETKWDLEIEAIWEKYNIWDVLLRADIMSGIGEDGWSVVFIGSDGAVNEPLDRGKLLYLHPYSQIKASIASKNNDVYSERFGLPLTYTLNDAAGYGLNRPVHFSRILHVVSDRWDSQHTGRPVLAPIWNYLIDLEKVIAGGAEATWRNADPIKHFNTKGDKAPGLSSGEGLSDDEIELIRDEIDDIMHGLETSLVTHDVEGSLLSGAVPKIKENAEAIISLIAGTVSIPQGELLGSQAGALASSEEDTLRVRSRTRERQKERAVPIIRNLVDKLMTMGVVSKVSDYDVVLPSIDEKSDREKGELIQLYAEANKANAEATGQPIITSDEIRKDVLDKEPLPELPVTPIPTPALARHAADLTDDPPNSADWKTVHKVADSHIEPLVDTIVDIFEIAAQDVTDIASAPDVIIASLESAITDLMPSEYMSIINDAGQSVLDLSKSRGSWFRSSARNAQFELDFNNENPSAVEWAATRSSELITEIGPDTRDGIKLLIAEGQARELTYQELVRRVRQGVGLRTDQVDALYGFMDRLADAEPGSQVFMGIRKGEEVYVTIPRTGLTRNLEIKYYNQYAWQLRQARAELISRTETLRSANRGVRELWFQADTAGQLPRGAQRVWIATLDERTREAHADWDGAVTGLHEPFEFGVEPGDEPNCRCTQGLVS